MFETIKTVNGHKIYRMKGVRKYYRVDIRSFGDVTEWVRFETIKAAELFCKSL